MPRFIVIGHYADGTLLRVQVPTLSEYLDERRRCHLPYFHDTDIRDVSTPALEERFHELVEFYEARALVDPRCGCSADNEGGKCYWDDLDQIDEELGKRRR